MTHLSHFRRGMQHISEDIAKATCCFRRGHWTCVPQRAPESLQARSIRRRRRWRNRRPARKSLLLRPRTPLSSARSRLPACNASRGSWTSACSSSIAACAMARRSGGGRPSACRSPTPRAWSTSTAGGMASQMMVATTNKPIATCAPSIERHHVDRGLQAPLSVVQDVIVIGGRARWCTARESM
jgi:hypothetical protein